MADFLTRLAGRALGLVPTVQPILAPMYVPGQQFVGAKDAQAIPLFERGAAAGYPQSEVRGQEKSLRDRPEDEPAFSALVGQRVDPLEMSFPLVPQENQPDTIPMHTPSRTLDEQPAADYLLSSEREETASSARQARRTASTRNASVSGLHSIHPTDATVIPLEARTVSIAAEQQRDSSLLPRTAREVLEAEELSSASALLLPLVPQGPVAASLASPVADTLPTQRPAAPKTIRPQQGSRRVGYPGYPYNRVNQHEIIPATQESSEPAPTIQVTIGRIEVRATPPPTPRAQTSRSAPSVMSLDDYLNQRAKGGH